MHQINQIIQIYPAKIWFQLCYENVCLIFLKDCCVGAVSEDVYHCFIMSFMKHTHHSTNYTPVTPLFPSHTSVSETSWVRIRVASANKVTMHPNSSFQKKQNKTNYFAVKFQQAIYLLIGAIRLQNIQQEVQIIVYAN